MEQRPRDPLLLRRPALPLGVDLVDHGRDPISNGLRRPIPIPPSAGRVATPIVRDWWLGVGHFVRAGGSLSARRVQAAESRLARSASQPHPECRCNCDQRYRHRLPGESVSRPASFFPWHSSSVSPDELVVRLVPWGSSSWIGAAMTTGSRGAAPVSPADGSAYAVR